MRIPDNPNANPILFALLPVVPSVFFGFIIVWQQGTSLTSLSLAFLMVLFSLVSSYFIWVWHSDQIEKLETYHQKKFSEGLNVLKSYTLELERLLLKVEPNLTEQVQAAKALTEQEIAQLIKRFSAMHGELNQLFDYAAQEAEAPKPENLDNLKSTVTKIRGDIDAVLEALQFQDRVSQILALVVTHLTTLRETLEHIQEQGPERHKKMLNVEETVAHIQTQYETVKFRTSRSTHKQAADDLTFF